MIKPMIKERHKDNAKSCPMQHGIARFITCVVAHNDKGREIIMDD